MQYSRNTYSQAEVKSAKFVSANADGEMHSIINISDPILSFSQQLSAVSGALKQLIADNTKECYKAVMVRLLLSDAANQSQMAMAEISKVVGTCAVAYVQQPPLNGTKLSAVVYMMQNVDVERVDDFTVQVKKGQFTHLWSANVCSPLVDTLAETHSQLTYLENMLASKGLNIADNCIRTWFYVQNIDVNYAAVVKARRDNFNENNLTVDTHYISSTGIGGRHAQKEVTSILDAYSVGGLQENQMGFLYAADNMNRTSDYGVTFERGTYVDYADRRQVYVSGTASIDNKGNVVAEGDIVAQTDRMLLNVKALLTEAGADFSDVAHIVVYLRDVADYGVVSRVFKQRFPEMPLVITLAPVCRPGWLIEMECMAVAGRKTSFGKL